ncbi:hypothetical protein SAMN05216331_11474 [Porphyromonadaceae bacterium KH3R12]|uniref:hypothetical protein n=1 Tax=Proteiniphilum saccharofermentans TaxID=1642647 RepID=UPI00089543E4|nr:hypothetical protein [Proteiniphilum saccharofermentans]SEA01326.1 hypothetical protein SAMN05216331_11474 [Porphyromonadaceae bacterium KH3R12]
MENLYALNWHFLSIYYAKSEWHNLLRKVKAIREIVKDDISYFIIYFSREKGENIRLAFSTLKNDDETGLSIHDALFSFIKQNPSHGNADTHFGEVLWCNYPNNSLVWDNFKIDILSSVDLQFEEQTSQLILRLLDNDFSDDNLFSIALLLNIKVLKEYENKNKLQLLRETIYYLSSHFNQFVDNDFLTDNLMSQFELNLSEVFEIMDLYWNESLDADSLLISDWIKYINLSFGGKESHYYHICTRIFKISGIGSIESVFLLQLLYKWFSLLSDEEKEDWANFLIR